MASALNGDVGDGAAFSSAAAGTKREQATTDLYELLQVSPQASNVVIRAAYRALARDYHPDVNDTPDAEIMMGRLNAAYAVLGDPVRRARYHAYYTKASRTAGATRANGGQPSTRRTGASRQTRTQYRAFAPPAASHPRDGSAVMLVGRLLIVGALTALVAVLMVTVWLAFSDADDRSPLIFGSRGGTSTGAPIVAPGARSQRPCGIGRVDILSC